MEGKHPSAFGGAPGRRRAKLRLAICQPICHVAAKDKMPGPKKPGCQPRGNAAARRHALPAEVPKKSPVHG
ncbi:hypothetical protein [Ensifer soli]|uniref:hypothetical protein n=1 Tax=Ciceribacter sp. sgz301302 TaxID=3342379 RepID=UPI0035B7D9CC